VQASLLWLVTLPLRLFAVFRSACSWISWCFRTAYRACVTCSTSVTASTRNVTYASVTANGSAAYTCITGTGIYTTVSTWLSWPCACTLISTTGRCGTCCTTIYGLLSCVLSSRCCIVFLVVVVTPEAHMPSFFGLVVVNAYAISV
jgi:hypothetical protein